MGWKRDGKNGRMYVLVSDVSAFVVECLDYDHSFYPFFCGYAADAIIRAVACFLVSYL
jgi:hypothetical protein